MGVRFVMRFILLVDEVKELKAALDKAVKATKDERVAVDLPPYTRVALDPLTFKSVACSSFEAQSTAREE
jgi:hypothetical protein